MKLSNLLLFSCFVLFTTLSSRAQINAINTDSDGSVTILPQGLISAKSSEGVNDTTNTALGNKALFHNRTNVGSTAVGFQAMYYANDEQVVQHITENTAVGYRALMGSTTPGQNVGRSNSALGYQALLNNEAGYDNVAIGVSALEANNDGYANVAIGSYALSSNLIGTQNTAVGFSALQSNTGGYGNNAIGIDALYSNTEGNSNSAIGYQSMYHNTTGSSNTANGTYSLHKNTTGIYNTAVGESSLVQNRANSGSTAIGYGAMQRADNRIIDARTTFNTAVGYHALRGGLTSSNNTGRFNTALGSEALVNNTSGSENTATGYRSLESNTTGNQNTATGNEALVSNTSGGENTATGMYSLNYNTEGSNNTATGVESLYNNTTGDYNTANGKTALHRNSANSRSTAIGYRAMYYADSRTTDGRETFNTALGAEALLGTSTAANNTGRYNTAIGDGALISISKGSHNVGLGYNANLSSGDLVNAIVIGSGATVNANNKIRMGNTSITAADIQVAWNVTSDRRWKEHIQEIPLGIAFIQDLRPVSYHRKNEESGSREFGLIAQELEETLSRHGYSEKDLGLLNKDSDGYYTVRYNDLIPVLLKGMQEQQALIQELTLRISKIENNTAASERSDLNHAKVSLESGRTNPVSSSGPGAVINK